MAAGWVGLGRPARYSSQKVICVVVGAGRPEVEGGADRRTWGVRSMIQSPTLDGLRELELHYRTPDARFARSPAAGRGCPSPLPLPVLRLAPTLQLLYVSCDRCRLDIPAGAPPPGLFPHLEQMTLKGVSIAEGTLHAILAGCPALRSLVLHYNIGYRRLRISSETLRSLSVTDGHRDCEGRFEEVIIELAPLLERLIPDGLMHDPQIRVIQAPKLKVLGHLYSRDGISTRVFKAFSGRWPRFSTAQRNAPLECLDAHLRVLQVTHYTGKPSVVDLVRFFLSNARVLESVRLRVGAVNCYQYQKWVATQFKKLRLDTGSAAASQGARIAFENDHWPSADRVPVKHIHDLALEDPFDRSLRE
ncbi:hypothetical protein C2845_PM13G03150 [Panicum miliaceum]|uniref:Uncharacterized protein n=1 Tax=Panicum miliaceum TaxID=4540 RepID=A0A3L6RH69_PANMI|nr:hypothetical protein C2845_PM13G03150 [Panicum miliaceum]